MLQRKDVASWLEGPGAVARTGRDHSGEQEWPGQRLGLPSEGPGSIADVGARLVAFLLDAAVCAAVAALAARDQAWTTPIFAIEAFVLTALAGGSIGQLLRGLRVVRVAGGTPGWGRAALRTALLLLLIPALIWDRDGRGLHDRLAGTVLIERGKKGS